MVMVSLRSVANGSIGDETQKARSGTHMVYVTFHTFSLEPFAVAVNAYAAVISDIDKPSANLPARPSCE